MGHFGGADGVELELNQIAQIDFTMAAGEVTETV